MIVDEDLVVASLNGAPPSPATDPLQLPSGMVLWARARPADSATPALTSLAVTPDHVDLATTCPEAPLISARGAWERLASLRLSRDLRAMG